MVCYIFVEVGSSGNNSPNIRNKGFECHFKLESVGMNLFNLVTKSGKGNGRRRIYISSV